MLVKLSRRRFSRYAKVSYASAADCGPTDTERPRPGCRIDVRSPGRSDTDGITLSTFSLEGIFLYSEAGMKNFRGRMSPAFSITLKRCGKNFNNVGFITSLHAKMTRTPTSTRSITTPQPMCCRSKGTVAGTGTSHAQPVTA